MLSADLPITSSLEITAIDTVALRVPLDQVYRGSKYKMSHRSTVIARVHTSEGVIGEAYAGDEDEELQRIQAVIRNEITPNLIGQDAWGVERCWELARPVTFDQLRDRRIGLVACACVDAAIWDAIGKATGQPLWRLWGGYRRDLPVICVGGYYGSTTDFSAEAAHIREMGFSGIKFKVGGLSPEEDAARFRQARAGAGEGFVILADANQAWTVEEAVRFARLVADDELYWFEEPCRWGNDRQAMRDVRFAAGVRVCAGQSEYSAAGCRDLMAAGAIDFCNFDSSWGGGATEWRRVAAIALTADIKMAHHEEPQIASHLLTSIPNGTFLEWFNPDRDPIWWNLIANRPQLVDGRVEMSDRPGLGWELDEDYIERYRVSFDG
jgi:L-alanine-DL-glutamate epimerase-like enolase superfamily enzyme